MVRQAARSQSARPNRSISATAVLARRRVHEALERLSRKEPGRLAVDERLPRSRPRTGIDTVRSRGVVAIAPPDDPQHSKARLTVTAGADSEHGGSTLACAVTLIIVLFMFVARRVLISGRVQGVGFRFFVEARAAVGRRARLGAQPARRPRRGARSRATRNRSIGFESRAAARASLAHKWTTSMWKRVPPSGARRASRFADRRRRAAEGQNGSSMDVLKVEDSTRTGFSEGRHSVLRRHHAPARSRRVSHRHRQPRRTRTRPRGIEPGRRHREPRVHPRRAVADRLGAGFVPVRKVGKLPSTTVKRRATISSTAATALEIHQGRGRARPARAHRRRSARDRGHRAGRRSIWSSSSAGR